MHIRILGAFAKCAARVTVYGPGLEFLIPEVFGIQILKTKQIIISNYNERTPEKAGKGENRYFENVCLSAHSLGGVALFPQYAQ